MDNHAAVEDQHELRSLSTDVKAAQLPAMGLITSTQGHGEPPKMRSKLQLVAVLAGLNLAMFTTALMQTVVSTAIPTIASELRSASGYVWIGAAYMLANTAASPIWTSFSDIWGRRLIILVAVAMFFLSSIVCAKATTMKMLIIGRSFQGCAGSGLVQLVMIIISDIFSVRQRGLIYGIIEVVWVIAGGAGPFIGGLLTQKVSWRWTFWIILPISGLTFVLLFFFLDVHNPRTPVIRGLKAVDWAGSLAILAMTLMVLLGLEFGDTSFPWVSPQVLCLVIIGSLLSIVFVFTQKKLAKYPLMPLDLFHDRSNVAVLVLTMLHGIIYMAGEYYLPLYFQSVLSASPSYSGALILPLTSMEALVGIGAGLYIHRTGRYLGSIHLGAIIMLLGNGLFILFSSKTSVGQIIGFQIIAGFGQGFLFSAPLIALHAFTPQASTASATSTFGFTRNLAGTLAIVICGVIFQNGMDTKAHTLSLPPTNLPSNITDALSGGHAAANAMIVSTIADPVLQSVVREAFVVSLRSMWIFTTALSGATVGVCLFIRKGVLSEEHVETQTGLGEKEKGNASELVDMGV